MKTKLQMIIRILTRKKVVLLTEECKGIHQMIFSGCDITEANRIKTSNIMTQKVHQRVLNKCL